MPKTAKHACRICINCRALNADHPPDNPGVIAFPPLIWLVNAVISVLVHLFMQLPIMRYGICLVCGIVLVVLAPTLALSALVTMKTAGTKVHTSPTALKVVRGGPVLFTRETVYPVRCLGGVSPRLLS